MKKIFFLIIALTTVLVSCEKKVDLSLQYEVLKSEAEPKDLWLFTMSNHLLGIDPVTFEEKLNVKFNYSLSNPLYINEKIYVGERTSVHTALQSSIWGYNIICLNNDLTLNTEITVHPNTYSISINGDYLVADTACYGIDEEKGLYSGFSVVDLKTSECIYKNESLNDMICNIGGCWSYKNRLFLGTYPSRANNDPFAVTIYNLDTKEFEALNSNIFTSHADEENLKWENAFVILNDNKLWINYYFYHTICVYDLDTYDPEKQTCKRIAKIDLCKDYNIQELSNEPDPNDIKYDENHSRIGDHGDYRMFIGQFVNDKYHVVLAPEHMDYFTETSFNGILVINPTTFELEKQIRIKDFLKGVGEIKYSMADEDILILRQYDNQIVTYDANTGELLDQKIVFQEYE